MCILMKYFLNYQINQHFDSIVSVSTEPCVTDLQNYLQLTFQLVRKEEIYAIFFLHKYVFLYVCVYIVIYHINYIHI